MKTGDRFFRTALLLLGALFLFLYYLHSENGRYQVDRQDATIFIFDSRRGIYYRMTPSGSVDVIDPIRGYVKFKKIPFLVKNREFLAKE